MIRVWLECLCFVSIFGIYCADNGVHRVSRQDFTHPSFSAPVAYQQPFDSRTGVFRVQRQDFTNTNDVPFADSYQGLYANRFSKLNYEFGNVNRSYTPLPKLFLPAVPIAPRVENPYLAIGVPNYGRVIPASNYGKEFPFRTSAPTRVTLRPQFNIEDDKRYDDSVLPALPNSRDDSALPPITDYSKSSSFDEDFSSVVEQFDMTEDKKSICKGVNCRRSSDDDTEAVKPIRRRRSAFYDPYLDGPHKRQNRFQTEFVPYYDRSAYNSRYAGNLFNDHDYNRPASVELVTEPAPTETAPNDELNPVDNDDDHLAYHPYDSEEFKSWDPWAYKKSPLSDSSDDETYLGYRDPLLGLDFMGSIDKISEFDDLETTTADDATDATTESSTTTESADPNQNVDTPIECQFSGQWNDAENSETTSDPTESANNSDDLEVTTSAATDPTDSQDPDSTTDIASPETRPTECSDLDPEKLTPEKKFVVLFACAMLPDMFKKSNSDSYDSETKNLYQMCNLLKTIDDQFLFATARSDTNFGEDESVTTTEIPDENEVLQNFFLQIINYRDENDPVASELEAKPDNDDAESVPSSPYDIPVVLTLRNYI